MDPSHLDPVGKRPFDLRVQLDRHGGAARKADAARWLTGRDSKRNCLQTELRAPVVRQFIQARSFRRGDLRLDGTRVAGITGSIRFLTGIPVRDMSWTATATAHECPPARAARPAVASDLAC